MCRSRRELSNAYLLAKIGVDTAEDEPCKVCPLSAYRSPRFTYWCTETIKDKEKSVKEYEETISVATSSIQALTEDIAALETELEALEKELEKDTASAL